MSKSMSRKVLDGYLDANKYLLGVGVGRAVGHLSGIPHGQKIGALMGILSKPQIDKLITNLMTKHKKVYQGKGMPLSVYAISKNLNNNYRFDGLKPHHLEAVRECCDEHLKGGGLDDLSGLGLGATIREKTNNIVKGVKDHFKKHGATYKKAGIGVGTAIATALAGKYLKNRYYGDDPRNDLDFEPIDMDGISVVNPNDDINVSSLPEGIERSGSDLTTIGLPRGQVANPTHSLALAQSEGETALAQFERDLRMAEAEGRKERHEALQKEQLAQYERELPSKIIREEADRLKDEAIERAEARFDRGEISKEALEHIDRTRTMGAIANPVYEMVEDIGQFQPSELFIPKEVVGKERDLPPRTLTSSETTSQTEAIRDRERERVQAHYDAEHTPPRQKYDGAVDGMTMTIGATQPTPEERVEAIEPDERQAEIDEFLGEIADESRVFKARQDITNQSLLNPFEPITSTDIQARSRIRNIGAKGKVNVKATQIKGTFPDIKLPARTKRGDRPDISLAMESTAPRFVPSLQRPSVGRAKRSGAMGRFFRDPQGSVVGWTNK